MSRKQNRTTRGVWTERPQMTEGIAVSDSRALFGPHGYLTVFSGWNASCIRAIQRI